MNSIVVKRCEENLRRRKHEILPVLKHLASESDDAAVGASTQSDYPTNDSAANLTARLAAVYERELNDIDTALNRIRTGTFGYCRACHQAIESSRLERFPRADFCMRCKNI